MLRLKFAMVAVALCVAGVAMPAMAAFDVGSFPDATKYANGGMVSDGSQFIYVTGGQSGGDAASTLWRYDTGNNTWSQMSSMPTSTGSANMVPKLGFLSGVGTKGSLIVGYNYWGGPARDAARVYDIDTDTWAELDWPQPVTEACSQWDGFVGIEGVNTKAFGLMGGSQGGLFGYEADTGMFTNCQHFPENGSNFNGTGADLAYAPVADLDGKRWMYQLGNRNGVVTLGRFDADQEDPGWTPVGDPQYAAYKAFVWDTWYSELDIGAGTIAFDGSNKGLTYVPVGQAVYLLHGEDAGAELYRVDVTGDAMFAAIGTELYRYDIGDGTWTVAAELPFTFGTSNVDDIAAAAAIPEPATMLLLAIGGVGLLIRRRKR